MKNTDCAASGPISLLPRCSCTHSSLSRDISVPYAEDRFSHTAFWKEDISRAHCTHLSVHRLLSWIETVRMSGFSHILLSMIPESHFTEQTEVLWLLA